jgi:hypothetical protein
VTGPALFIACHPDDETLMMGSVIGDHTQAVPAQDVHVLLLTDGGATSARGRVNGTSGSGLFWNNITHDPVLEGYDPLMVEDVGVARQNEFIAACAALGVPLSHLHFAGLPDGPGGVVVAAAQAAILAVCDEIAPGGPVRLKGHTYVTGLDDDANHLAAGTAQRNLWLADPTRFSDSHHYVLWEAYGTRTAALAAVSATYDNPNTVDIGSRAKNASTCYGAWQPHFGAYALGQHSTYSYHAALRANPRSLVHLPS